MWLLFSKMDSAIDLVPAQEAPLWCASARMAARHHGRDVRTAVSCGDPAIVIAQIVNEGHEPLQDWRSRASGVGNVCSDKPPE